MSVLEQSFLHNAESIAEAIRGRSLRDRKPRRRRGHGVRTMGDGDGPVEWPAGSDPMGECATYLHISRHSNPGGRSKTVLPSEFFFFLVIVDSAAAAGLRAGYQGCEAGERAFDAEPNGQPGPFVEQRAHLALKLPFVPVTSNTFDFVESAFPRIIQRRQLDEMCPGQAQQHLRWEQPWPSGPPCGIRHHR